MKRILMSRRKLQLSTYHTSSDSFCGHPIAFRRPTALESEQQRQRHFALANVGVQRFAEFRFARPIWPWVVFGLFLLLLPAARFRRWWATGGLRKFASGQL